MAAPQISFSQDFAKVSQNQHITVTFWADLPYTEFQARATKTGAAYGVGLGSLLAAFGATPAATSRTFEVYNTDLVNGDGEYRLSLFARGEDGAWNDDLGFIVVGGNPLATANNQDFLVQKQR